MKQTPSKKETDNVRKALTACNREHSSKIPWNHNYAYRGWISNQIGSRRRILDVGCGTLHCQTCFIGVPAAIWTSLQISAELGEAKSLSGSESTLHDQTKEDNNTNA